jgi:hypothetical protein
VIVGVEVVGAFDEADSEVAHEIGHGGDRTVGGREFASGLMKGGSTAETRRARRRDGEEDSLIGGKRRRERGVAAREKGGGEFAGCGLLVKLVPSPFQSRPRFSPQRPGTALGSLGPLGPAGALQCVVIPAAGPPAFQPSEPPHSASIHGWY